jgi:hypothetical protein
MRANRTRARRRARAIELFTAAGVGQGRAWAAWSSSTDRRCACCRAVGPRGTNAVHMRAAPPNRNKTPVFVRHRHGTALRETRRCSASPPQADASAPAPSAPAAHVLSPRQHVCPSTQPTALDSLHRCACAGGRNAVRVAPPDTPQAPLSASSARVRSGMRVCCTLLTRPRAPWRCRTVSEAAASLRLREALGLPRSSLTPAQCAPSARRAGGVTAPKSRPAGRCTTSSSSAGATSRTSK